MKKLFLILLTAGIAGISVADIQAPPGETQGPLRKLSRGLANIIYGVTEVPTQWSKSMKTGGSSEAAGYGTVLGVTKTVARFGYGIFEVVTFPVPVYKGTFKAPYHPDHRESTHPLSGFSEMPPEVGFISGTQACRSQTY